MMRSVFAAVAFLVALTALPAAACDALRFDDAFLRETPMKISAGYVTIDNCTDTADTLTGASADWADKIEIHNVKINDSGVLEMLPMGALDIASQTTETLKPGGRHLMIYGLKEPLKVGDVKSVTLTFDKAGAVTTPFTVQPIAYRGKAEGETPAPTDAATDHGQHGGHDGAAHDAHAHH